MSKKLVHIVIQEGGVSAEVYVYSFGTKRDAQRFRRNCAKAAYLTSEPVAAPRGLCDTPEFFPTLSAVVKAYAAARAGA